MCDKFCLEFGDRNLLADDITGKRVLEVGSRNINGTLRGCVMDHSPAEYIGVDMIKDSFVDTVCKVEDLIKTFGPDSFDLVISTEMMEHVEDWRAAIKNIKGVCRPGGIILITTRSKGFPYHDCPFDFWRYEIDDMKKIFSDCEILVLESAKKGVFIKARKPKDFKENDLSGIRLFSVIPTAE
jgi:SAM-dependent methyltransferase